MLSRSLSVIVPILLVASSCGREPKPSNPPRQPAPPVAAPTRSDSVFARAFLDTLVSGLDTTGLARQPNETDHGRWQPASVLSFISDSGLSFHDSTTGSTWSASREDLRAQIVARDGVAQLMLVHLAYAAAQERPQFERLIVFRHGDSTIVHPAGWDGFRIAIVREGSRWCVRRIEYIEADAE